MMIYFEALGLLAVFAIAIVGLIIGLSVVLRQPVMVTLVSLIMSVAAIAAAGRTIVRTICHNNLPLKILPLL